MDSKNQESTALIFKLLPLSDRKLFFEPAEALTQESGRCQPFFLFLIRD